MLGKTHPEEISKGDDVLINHPNYGTLWLCDVKVYKDDNGRPVRVDGMVEDRSVPQGRSPMNFPISCVWKRSQDLIAEREEGDS